MVTTTGKQSGDNVSKTSKPTSSEETQASDDQAPATPPTTAKRGSGEGTNDLETEKNIVWIGMDLGTSRTAIACSNGVRESLPSLVGYPKDVVSQKLLGSSALFGDDVLKHRLSLNTYRPLETGLIKGSN